MPRSAPRRTAPTALVAAALAAAAATVLLAGCGLAVQAPDLFAVTRTGGAGKPLTIVINDSGTVSCDRGPAKPISDRLLVVARSLVGQLDSDALKKLKPPSPPHSFYRFQVRLEKGSFSFPDTSAAHRPELAKLEQFLLQVEPLCGAGG
ncbi:MAG TPA: hypothetical protein VG186_13295 [Solirubrobacteraceae bacterium]|jgi:hypothetical protein|nr:hypothetical protein [Solirubrobacteraceae bacterium]